MKTHTEAQLNEILRNHKHWALRDCDGWESMRADLSGANLSEANLSGANLSGAKNIPYIPMACPDSGAFTAWKKARGKIVKLLVPENAKRSSATGRKCRCDKAVVLAIENIDGTDSGLSSVASGYDPKFLYTINETATVPDFCENRFLECASGIHFFINRKEAVDYNG
nr:MAG TPA: pentapeptide repeat protein [Caudoviricetes sp.]